MIKDLVLFVSHYPELYEVGARRGMDVSQLVLRAVRKFDREFVADDADPEDLLTIKESGTLNHEQARALYRQLSSYFARHGVKQLTAAQKRTRAAAGAKGRWGKPRREPSQ